MKIVCIGYFHGFGGAARQLIMLANALVNYDYQVSLIILADCKIGYKIDKRVNIINLSNYEISNKKLNIFIRFLHLLKALLKLKPDITISYWLQPIYMLSFLPKKIYGKLIYSERCDPGDMQYNGFLGKMRSLAFKNVDGFVFQTEGAKSYFNEDIRSRSLVIPNSVDIPKKYHNLNIDRNREKTIVNVGRLCKQKNQALLIESFKLIADEFPDYNLVIYGDGLLKNELLNQINSLSLENRVFIIDSSKDLFDKICYSSLFVLTSDYEGLPNSLMEAMALGIPSISTDCRPGGARALIRNGKNGLITPIGDKFALANAMKYLIKNPDVAYKFAELAKNIINTNSSQRVFLNWNEYIKKIGQKNK